MVATVLAILSLLLPPVSLFSAAVIALVTLRKGANEGALVLAMASVACSLLALLLFGQPWAMAGFVLLMWMPAWMLALQLRASRSLSLAIQFALLFGLLVIGAQYLQSDGPVAGWQQMLEPFVAELVTAKLVAESDQQALIEVMASWMPGLVAAGFFLQLVGSLFIARWWQAMLYNPGGFGEEFRTLRWHRLLALVTLAVIAARWLMADGNLPDYLLVLLLAAWFIQGLAVVHGVIRQTQASRGWLIGLYLLLLVAMPHALTALAVTGFADAWIDFRARLRNRAAG